MPSVKACSYLFDVYMTYFYVPQPLFPAMVICTKGLLEPLGWLYGGIGGFYGFIVLFGACSMSIVWAFAYRYTLVTNRAHLLNCPLGVTLMALGQVFYEAPTLFFYTLSILDREAVVEVNYAVSSLRYSACWDTLPHSPCSALSQRKALHGGPLVHCYRIRGVDLRHSLHHFLRITGEFV